MGRATEIVQKWSDEQPFQSTPSVGRATGSRDGCTANAANISIHALRGEGDVPKALAERRRVISIHALRGEGDGTAVDMSDSIRRNFNPRPPWGGRHHCVVDIIVNTQISIHALRGEGDSPPAPPFGFLVDFNPRPPWGGRRYANSTRNRNKQISIHALRGEGDQISGADRKAGKNFNPRPPWGGRLLQVK